MSISFAAQNVQQDNDWQRKADILKNIRVNLAGVVNPIDNMPVERLGFNGKNPQIVSNSPGLQVGLTTYDLQGWGRMNRQVEWRNNQMVHFAWTKQLDSVYPGLRGTGYEVWNPNAGPNGSFVFQGDFGGCNVHPIEGFFLNYSGFPSLDVTPGGVVVIGNHHKSDIGQATTIWYDYVAGNCFFGPGKYRLPDSTMQYGCNSEDIQNGFWFFQLPSISYQIYNGDSVTHIIAIQNYGDSAAITSYNLHYFRRVGSAGSGNWDYPPMIIDTISGSGFTVAASRSTGKVALVWLANPGNYPGDPESVDRYEIDDGLGWSARTNDVFCMMSDNMGSNWGPKTNITAFDSSLGGWLAGWDVSALIASDDILHIAWTAREVSPLDGHLGEWTNYYGSRLYHWDELSDEVRIIKDANWPITEPDSLCAGGVFNYQWAVKPMISECEGKFYTVFVQFHDIPNGLVNDCAESRYSGDGGAISTANGELYLTVSDDGYNWDIARNLTNTITPHCYADESEGTPVCESDLYPSMPRFGMEDTHPTGFDDAVIVDPSDGAYDGNHYLDVFYINDKYPGYFLQEGAGVWTINPVKWFRIPCVEPVPNPILAISPDSIGPPAWTKPGIQCDTTIKLENIGNTELYISTIQCYQVNGPPGWLTVNNYGPITISHLSPNYQLIDANLNAGGVVNSGPAVLEGYIEISSDMMGGRIDSIPVKLIVADSLMFPQTSEIRTSCIRLAFNNAGCMGGNDGGYNMNFFDDCDTTDYEFDDVDNIYLYKASPFIALIKDGDTILDYSMYNATWLSNNGLRPLEDPYTDSISSLDYQYGFSGRFLSHDSSIVIESKYYAPQHSDTCCFIVVEQRVYLNVDTSISDIYIGDFLDWDIPSDSNVENGSNYNSDERLIYCFGGEYGPDSIANNDCVLAYQRLGGIAYYSGYRIPFMSEADSFPNPRAMWTHINADWVYPTGGFVTGQMYKKINETYGYSRWQSTNPGMEDSLYQDLHIVVVFGQFDLNADDTLVFEIIIISEYDGGLSGLNESLEKAKTWIENHLRPIGRCCFGDQGSPDCIDTTYLGCSAKTNMISWDTDKS
jgi:hypothetical protein